jgi:ankyrin repeat protein
MQEKTLPKGKNASSAKPNLNVKKDAVENAPGEEAKKQLNQRLLVAIRSGWTDGVKELVKKGADLEAKDNLGMTPLMWAASKDQFHICTVLIEMGADLEAKDISGFTPLMHAANEGHVEICLRLIKKGANMNARNEHRWTALMLAGGRGSWGVCGLLVEMGADVNAEDDHGVTAAIRARCNGHKNLGTYLMLVSIMGNEKRVEFTSYLNGCISLQKR